MNERIRKLPKITIDDFEKLIPMFVSDDTEINKLGIELFKTFDYSDLPYTTGILLLRLSLDSSTFRPFK